MLELFRVEVVADNGNGLGGRSIEWGGKLVKGCGLGREVYRLFL